MESFSSFEPNIFWIKFSLDPKFLSTQNFVDSKFFWTQKFVDLKLYQHNKILDQKLFFSPKTFLWRILGNRFGLKKKFFNQHFFQPNFFRNKKCLDLKFFWTENFWDQIVLKQISNLFISLVYSYLILTEMQWQNKPKNKWFLIQLRLSWLNAVFRIYKFYTVCKDFKLLTLFLSFQSLKPLQVIEISLEEPSKDLIWSI